MTCEDIKRDMFDINPDMPTGQASPSLPRLELVDSGPARTAGRHPCPFYFSNRPKTRLERSQRSIIALFPLHNDI